MFTTSTRHPITAAVTFTGAALFLGTSAAALQVDPGSEGLPFTVAVSATSVPATAEASYDDPDTESRSATARSLRRQAERLYANVERWEDAAVYHAHAALLSGFEGREAASDLVLAANLFWREGERELACATLHRAGRVALGYGDVRGADRAFRRADRVGDHDCGERLDELLEGRIVAAPAVVRVEAPRLDIRGVEETGIRPVIERPELPRPPLGTLAVTIPPAPGKIQVEAPVIELPDLEEARIAPVLRLPGSSVATARKPGGTR